MYKQLKKKRRNNRVALITFQIICVIEIKEVQAEIGNYEAASLGKLQNFYFKKFSSIHKDIGDLQNGIHQNSIMCWI